jgi:hypothetical protein
MMLREYPVRHPNMHSRLFSQRLIGLAVAALFCGRAMAAPAAEAASPVDSVRQSVTEWAKIRTETVRLETNWESERELLNSTLKAQRERAQTLVTQKKTLESKTAGERDSLATIAAQNTTAEAALNAATDRLRKIGTELLALRPWLPPRLSQALELPYRSLANPALTPGERMQFVTTILNRCAQFNKAITYGDELLTLPGETGHRMLEVIYWGASHAYALDRSGGKGYFGSPGAQGWTWEPAPGAEKSFSQLIAIYRDKADPQFVEVPAHVSDVLPN